MIRRRLWASLIACVGVPVIVLAANLIVGNSPVLGLDLQGGLSVVLAPSEGASDDDLIVIRDLVRTELENRGIAEPDVRVEGQNIVVDLPGVRDQREALDAADVAGIVTLRPVIQCIGPQDPSATSTTVPGGTTTTVAGATSTSAAGSSTTDPPSSPTTSASSPTTAGDTTLPAGLRSPAAAAPTTTSPPSASSSGTGPTTSEATTGTTDVGGSTTTTPPDGSTTTTEPGASSTSVPTAETQTELLPTLDGGTCLVGPPGGTGELFARDSAGVELDPQQGWTVNVGLSGSGESAWNALAAQCFNGLGSCPSTQLAIVLDGTIQSSPQVNAPSFSGSVSITGSFGEDEARSLARVLNRGAFPVDVEVRRVETVSPTLGEDSLRASVFAGLVGVVLLLGVLFVFYRWLTPLIALGLVVWAMLIYSVAAIISQTTNYALTLAGVTGIVVSIGITVDSYVIYFERLKDEVVHGRTLRNSAARGFKATWRTILAANLVAFIAAAVLFVLSVGSVRGFALYLGVTTICDVLVLYFFTRPAVILLAESGRLDRRDVFGLGLVKAGRTLGGTPPLAPSERPGDVR